jgi:hypothetical protein
MTCGFAIEVLATGEVLECVMDAHSGTSLHSTDTHEFRRLPNGQWIVRDFATGLRPVVEAIPVGPGSETEFGS